ncbi:hypothetical protein [Streptomyces sp. NPDC088348]|uniref:hypothetical protein n=1 Tax=Streptomyces sp. NPDC088348 TaxID=3365853 RepID=UPI00380C2B02
MAAYFPPVDEHETVIKAALRAIQADHYGRADDPHADAEQQYAREQLALAARALGDAVDQQPADDQPIRWEDAGISPAHAHIEELQQLVADFIDPDPCEFDHHGYCQAHYWSAIEPACPHGRAKKLGLQAGAA